MYLKRIEEVQLKTLFILILYLHKHAYDQLLNMLSGLG